MSANALLSPAKFVVKKNRILLQISLRIVPKIFIFTGLYLHKSFRSLPLDKHPLKNLPYAAVYRG